MTKQQTTREGLATQHSTANATTVTIITPAALYADDKALDVLGYIATLRRWLVPAAAVALVVLLAGLAFAFTRPPSYSADATVLLVPAAVSSEAEATQQAAMLPMVARSYAQMANSELVIEPVAKQMYPDKSASMIGAITSRISIGYPANSLVIKFTVKGNDADETVKLTNALVDSYVKQVPEFGPGVGNNVSLGAKVISRPITPLQPEASTRLELAALSVVGALALGFLTAVALDLTIGRRRRATA